MGLSHLPHLQAMLDVAKERIGVGQGVGVVLAHIPARSQGRDGRQGPGQAQLEIGPTVDELQQLNRELDVPDSTRGPLDVVGVGAFLRSLLELAKKSDGIRADAGGPHEFSDRR